LDHVIVIKQVLNIFTAISYLTLIALGLYVIYGLMGVINMAHGDFVMLGAYAQITLLGLGLNFWLAVAFSVLLITLLGAVVERAILRPLHGRGDLTSLLATWGLSIVFQQSIRLSFGPQPQFTQIPVAGSVAWLAGYPLYPILVAVLVWSVIAVMVLIFMKSRFGIMLRATMDNQTMAEAVGIRTSRIYLYTFALGTGLAAFAGALLSGIVGVTPAMGLDYISRSFFVVIIGGSQSIYNILGGAGIIAGSDSILRILSNGMMAQIIVLCFVIIVMFIRPQGVFSRK
jgi:branched-chain amino acid transport system permease protein/urea transport system permease protein